MAIIDPAESLEVQNKKLQIIVEKLMTRVEHSASDREAAFTHFERSIALEEEIRARTVDLQEALEVLNATNAQLASAKNETEKAQQNLVNAMEAIQEGFAIFDHDENLVMHNSHFLGLLPDVLNDIHVGMSFQDYIKLSASSEHIIFPNEMDHDEWIVHRLNAHKNGTVNFILPIKNDHWLNISEQRSDDGSTIVLQTDVTDRIRLEKEERLKFLDEQAKIIKATLDHIEQGVMIIDRELRLTEINAQMRALLNLPARVSDKGARLERTKHIFEPGYVIEQKSKPIEIYHWLCGKDPSNMFRKEVTMTNGQIYSVFGQVMPDGSRVLTFANITELRQLLRELSEANENLERRVYERTQDIKEARDAAERANASKTRFVAAASHDLLQPINAAKLYLGLLGNTSLEKRQSDIVTRATNSFHSVETMLGALLDISRLDSDEIAMNVSEFSLNPIFEHIESEFAELAAQKGLKLRRIETRAVIASDPTYIRRIIQNLISNAIRYTPEGKILLGTKKRGQNLEIVVQDTGIGIAPEDQKRIFNEFQRLSPEMVHSTAMGLGLSIVEKACKNLGHELKLESTLAGGTRFGIVVPLIAREPVPSTNPSTRSRTQPNFKNTIILVIENDLEVQNAMMQLLENWGASPMSATNQSEALERVASLGIAPDVVIADYHLDNGTNGLETIEEIRSKYGPFIAILLTADRDQNLEQQAQKQGVFLRYKPADLAELSMLLRKR